MRQRHRYANVTYETGTLSDGRGVWTIPNKDGRFNRIKTDGIETDLASADAKARYWINQWHDLRANIFSR